MGCGASSKNAAAPGEKPAAGRKGSETAEIKKDNVAAGALNHSANAIDNPGKIEDFYSIDKKKLGEGSYGSVSKCTNKATSKVCACKSICLKQVKNLDRFKQEIQIMKIMDHPNILKLYESFQDHRNIYLILELCTGGELFDRIIEDGHFTETRAAHVMQNMFRAIFYMHENHLCHRDLKPENFLFTTKEAIEKTHLKVIDFGLACQFKDGQVLKTKAGTPYYVAPQVLAGKYDQSSDVWSLGVIMYVLLCGYPPFHGETDKEVLDKVRLGNFSFNSQEWKHVSEDAKELIQKLLKMNPRDRFTAEQALNHSWVANKAPKAKDVAIGASIVDNLKGFQSQNKFKKAALHLIASQMSENQIDKLRQTFMQLDKNGDGLLTVVEMKEGLEKAGVENVPPELKAILMAVDSDGSGVVDYTEFLAATLDKSVYMKEDVCWQAFRIFDRNGDGKIDKKEMSYVLNDDGVQGAAGRDIAQIMQDVDEDGDGEINFQEFMSMMKKA